MPAGMEDPFRANGETVRREQEAPREVNFEKAAMPMDKVPIAKIRKSKVVCSSTIEGLRERLYEPNKEEEKKTLQDLVQNLKRMLNEQNEYNTTLKG